MPTPRACCSSCASLNWNARLALIVSPINMVGVGLTESTMTAFAFLITRSNFLVGLSSTVSGLALLLVAPCAGCLADRVGRQAVLRLASALAVLSAAWVFVWLLYFQPHTSDRTCYALLLGSQFLGGLRRGIQQPAFDAIFGDSVASGRRSQIYSWLSSLRKLGLACGPATAAAIFFARGDSWTEPELVAVLLAGAAVRLVPAALLWLFRDERSLGQERGVEAPPRRL
ncbi:hypothetical protein EMIHUDRAFT_247234 [Emiliania huxleyi CCMP1516]|uniref:Major facilitator superfamily (MFS) profile domain-containing protein n=2 Tax=Emiliania huxleyi TaxID=2903 RepID=A0A0D3ING6_EMIH1|nr:hypothetical protein EMIHUDRAFT_247234 [Emiliania huxleyi CCMP1516]EOD12801.1 hypothetical protein EMIHUDRAFT_247234 [Emiliania huxleyi CCMP1516]|eukprot:XP_005765230.1 hypothetical protein EMIHUDRAFT_247234 [Emiliania huxleyi CCMP1516]